jgi:2-polyprenyl-6-methoxyphenol hydroxylase-like FAD-dependent oxidoreductase
MDALRLEVNGSRSVLVCGAGLAGLSAALELAERGYKVRRSLIVPTRSFTEAHAELANAERRAEAYPRFSGDDQGER